MMKFPIVCFKKGDQIIYAYCDEKKFSIADKSLVESGVFESVTIIDSDGEEFSIKSVKNLGWAGPFWGFNLMLKGRQIKIDFEVVKIKNLTLTDFKDRITAKLKYNPNYYESEIKNIVDDAKNFETIIKLFC